MKIIEINNQDYNLPEGWHEVNVATFELIMKAVMEKKDEDSDILYALNIFSILLNADIEIIKTMTRDSYEKLAELCDWCNQVDEIQNNDINEWIIDGVEYIGMKNLKCLTMGETVSLETVINNSKEYEVLTNILPVLIRKVKKVTKNGIEVKVPAPFDADEYSELKEIFKNNLMISDVLKIKSFF